ncbi:hypothetical protein [Streptomyces sp. H34-S4]|uniref:hypothetical protein n=1 Tax=Streptomyces sp. H34-S4 TaxID=2996463 RepID=UPI00226E8447|nr:hypothetical protein [Streptomyces sp. H34-S4]MCY0933649.1 hypothetical protein [Streptomyces sp. H34-S4]
MPYTVKWTEIVSYKRKFSDEEMAELKGVPLAELAEMDEDDIEDDLKDELADLTDNGSFVGVQREVDEVIEH